VEPAVAALVGLVLLGEALIARQWVAVVLVVIASAGASRSAATLQPPEPDVPPPAA
jgi:inner membrane transporter RhtA